MSYEQTKTCEVICPQCQNAMVKLMSMPAKTPTAWNGGWTDGMDHTYFSRALGRKVANKRVEEKILNDAGFVSESDLGQDWFEKRSAEVRERRAAQDEKSDIYHKTLEETGDAVKAVEAAFPAHECLDGTLDKIYNEKIEA